MLHVSMQIPIPFATLAKPPHSILNEKKTRTSFFPIKNRD